MMINPSSLGWIFYWTCFSINDEVWGYIFREPISSHPQTRQEVSWIDQTFGNMMPGGTAGEAKKGSGGISPEILGNLDLIDGRDLQFRFLKWPMTVKELRNQLDADREKYYWNSTYIQTSWKILLFNKWYPKCSMIFLFFGVNHQLKWYQRVHMPPWKGGN